MLVLIGLRWLEYCSVVGLNFQIASEENWLYTGSISVAVLLRVVDIAASGQGRPMAGTKRKALRTHKKVT